VGKEGSKRLNCVRLVCAAGCFCTDRLEVGQWGTWLVKRGKSDCVTKLEANSVLAPVSTLLKQSWLGIGPDEKIQLVESEAR